MNTKQKGNGLTVIIIIVAILVLAFLIYKLKSNTKSITPTNANGAQSGQMQAASVDSDLTKVDASLNGLTQDSASIDGSLNDQAVAQPQ